MTIEADIDVYIKSPRYEPTAAYEPGSVLGWPVMVDAPVKGLSIYPDFAGILRFKLLDIARVVPSPALAKLREVKIWVVEYDEDINCAAYNPNPAWLADHGKNPDWAYGIVIGNLRNFLAWIVDQPWMLMHELAHAYHHRVLTDGFMNADILTAYNAAVKSKLYDSVLHFDGNKEKAYGLTNHKEFFAEMSETFFGVNDFYPFVAAELAQYDPATCAAIKKAWGL